MNSKLSFLQSLGKISLRSIHIRDHNFGLRVPGIGFQDRLSAVAGFGVILSREEQVGEVHLSLGVIGIDFDSALQFSIGVKPV